MKKPSKKIVTIKAKIYKPTKKGGKKGTDIELEHTPNRRLASIIAGNHEDEYANYYKRLVKMEQGLKKENKKRKLLNEHKRNNKKNYGRGPAKRARKGNI